MSFGPDYHRKVGARTFSQSSLERIYIPNLGRDLNEISARQNAYGNKTWASEHIASVDIERSRDEPIEHFQYDA
jgi:hypothetical protein